MHGNLKTFFSMGKNVYNVLQQNNNKERYSVGRDCALPIAIAAKLLIFFYRLLLRNSKQEGSFWPCWRKKWCTLARYVWKAWKNNLL